MDDYAHGRNKTPLPPGLTRFDWYTKVKDILPDDWKLMDEWATEKATVRDVLSHQSGLPRYIFILQDSLSHANSKRLTATICRTP